MLRPLPDTTQNRDTQPPPLGAESLAQVRGLEAMIGWLSPSFDSNSTSNRETFLMKIFSKLYTLEKVIQKTHTYLYLNMSVWLV